jgi:aldehyde dehydrogenase (NAD+)
MATTLSTTSISVENIHQTFEAQKANQQNIANTTATQRIAKLKKLHRAVLMYKDEIRSALYKDFKKHPSEVDLTEIYPVTGDIKHTISHLQKWMRPEKVGTPMALLGSSSWIHYEPKGVCLIISPWNFPINLTFGPLVSAIAAGNCVMIKPSEHTPEATKIMAKIVKELFDENEVALFDGGIETSTQLLDLPFNHIFFTGAPSIGKVVMTAAAKNLTSVTLELGGKSPTIVDETADLKAAAKRISWAKCLNNGQICIAPDYIFVHESKKDELVNQLDKSIKAMYGDSIGQSDSYCRIVNNKHYHRIKSYVDDALSHDATVERGGQMNDSDDFIEPTIVSHVDTEMDLMMHEIFGPVLPIITYKNLEEVVSKINEKDKPLALYIYSKKKKNINYIMNNTRAGGTCINHSAIHFFNNNLPFGGVNNSGIGKAHGEYGFKAFSNARGVLKQWSPMSAIEMMTPPYNNLKQTLIDLSIKYF